MMPAVRWSPAPGSAVKEGRAISATFIRKVPEPLRQLVDALEECRRQRAGGQQPRIEQFRIDAGGDVFRADGLAVVEDRRPTARSRSTITSRTPASVSISAPCAARRARHRLRDRAHAADGVAPHALLAVHLAERVVQHHIGRAGGVGAGVIADDGVEAEQRLDQIAFEPLVEHLAGRAREQVEQAALLLERRACAGCRRCRAR